MSSRLDLQSSEGLAQYMGSLRTDLDALKTQNQPFGPDALVIKRVGRTSGWDVNTSVAAFALVKYRCTFVPATLQNPYVEFVPQVVVTGGTGYEVITFWPDAGNNYPTSRPFIVALSNDANTVTLQILAAFKCSDSGTVTVVSI